MAFVILSSDMFWWASSDCLLLKELLPVQQDMSAWFKISSYSCDTFCSSADAKGSEHSCFSGTHEPIM